MRIAISIHAAREGGDKMSSFTFTISFISIHAAREGGDVIAVYMHMPHMIFQSTPPVKAATFNLATIFTNLLFQSTPPVKAATILTAFRIHG